MYAILQNSINHEFLAFDHDAIVTVGDLGEAQLFVVEHQGFGQLRLRSVGGPRPGDATNLLQRIASSEWDLRSVELKLAEPVRYVG